jgi:hypothetical protein
MNIKQIEILWNNNKKEIINGNIVVGEKAEKIRARVAKQITAVF